VGVKFGRNFLISISDYGSTEVKTIAPPFTIKFNITRNMTGAPSGGLVQIYNLNKDSRAFIRKDKADPGFIKGISFLAGYGSELSTLMMGDIYVGSSERVGVDNITTVEAYDGGVSYLNSDTEVQYVTGTPTRSILENLARSLSKYGIKPGAISETYTTKNKRGSAYSGNTIDIMNNLSGGGVFIDNGKINVLRDNEYIMGDTLSITAKTGLLNTPKRENTDIVFNMLLEPRVYLGQKLKVDIGNKEFDGEYLVRTINHSGTISQAIGESAVTAISCAPAKYMVGVF